MNALVHDPVTLAYHELRSPLGLVATAMRAVVEQNLEDHIRDQVEIALRTVERVLRTTERVVGIAHRAAADDEQEFEPAAVAYQVAGDLAAAGLPLVVRQRMPQPRCRGPRGVYEALIHSLLINAGDHYLPGSSIEVTLTMRRAVPVIIIENQVGTGRHRGLGAGSYLAERLAEQIGASLRWERLDCRFLTTLAFPPAPAPLAAHPG